VCLCTWNNTAMIGNCSFCTIVFQCSCME
jgi:hypothetical protein